MNTPAVPLNFEQLGFLAGIKGCVNFNMTNPVTKKNLLFRCIQRYKGLLWRNHVINVKFDSPSLFLGAWKKYCTLRSRACQFFFGTDGPQWQNGGSVHKILTSISQICPQQHHSTNNMTLSVKDQRMGVGKEEKKRFEYFTQCRDCIGVEFGCCTIKTRRAYWIPILRIFMEHICTTYSSKFNGTEGVVQTLLGHFYAVLFVIIVFKKYRPTY